MFSAAARMAMQALGARRMALLTPYRDDINQAMRAWFEATDPALLLLAEIVRAADSHPSNPHPAGEGLRWIAFGFSALGLSDHEILEREFIVYDALYAECKRRGPGAL